MDAGSVGLSIANNLQVPDLPEFVKDCIICQRVISKAVRIKRCRHLFCYSCIVKHFVLIERACPICQLEVKVDEEGEIGFFIDREAQGYVDNHVLGMDLVHQQRKQEYDDYKEGIKYGDLPKEFQNKRLLKEIEEETARELEGAVGAESKNNENERSHNDNQDQEKEEDANNLELSVIEIPQEPNDPALANDLELSVIEIPQEPNDPALANDLDLSVIEIPQEPEEPVIEPKTVKTPRKLSNLEEKAKIKQKVLKRLRDRTTLTPVKNLDLTLDSSDSDMEINETATLAPKRKVGRPRSLKFTSPGSPPPLRKVGSGSAKKIISLKSSRGRPSKPKKIVSLKLKSPLAINVRKVGRPKKPKRGRPPKPNKIVSLKLKSPLAKVGRPKTQKKGELKQGNDNKKRKSTLSAETPSRSKYSKRVIKKLKFDDFAY